MDKKLRCNHCEIDIQPHNLEKHIQSKKHLVASGFWSSIKGVIGNIADRFKGKRLDGFNNESTKTLNTYGDQQITGLTIAKKPVHSLIDKFINVMTLSKWNELKSKYGFDKMMHLCLVVKLANGTNIYIEKIDAVTISTTDKIKGSDTIYLQVQSPNNLSLSQFVDGSRSYVNNDKKFFDYDAFTNNCQIFVSYFLNSIGKYGKTEKDFLYQDVSNLSKEMPTYAKTIMNGITNLGQIFNRVRGAGEIHKVKISKNISKEHAHKHAQDIAGTKKRLLYKELTNHHVFRIVPKTRFDTNTFKIKHINKDVKVIVGKLL